MKEPRHSHEADEQAAVIRWRDQMVETGQHPELCLLQGSLNGVRLNIGQAVKAKAQGMVKGWPDLELPVARHGYHGLFIEMKKIGGKGPRPEQKAIQAALNEAGNLAIVCYGADEAIAVIEKYLSG